MLSRLVFSVVLGSAVWGAAHALEVPPGPPNPRSGDECIAAFEPTFRQHYAAWGACDKRCSSILQGGGRDWTKRYTACYKDCGSARSAKHAAIVSAREACFQRVKQASQDERQRIAEGMQLGRKLLERAEEAHELVTDPVAFLVRKVSPEPSLSERLFGKAPESERTTIWNEVFRYTTIQARYGLEQAKKYHRSDLIKSIQQNALDTTVAMYGDAFTRFDAALADVNNWSRDTEASYRSTGRAYSPATVSMYSALVQPKQVLPKPKKVQSVPGECAIFNDPPRSNDLMLADPDRWTALLRKCKQ